MNTTVLALEEMQKIVDRSSRYVSPTIDLHINYHRSAKPCDLYTKEIITNLGSTIDVAQSRITDEANRLITAGRCLYMISEPPPINNSAIKITQPKED